MWPNGVGYRGGMGGRRIARPSESLNDRRSRVSEYNDIARAAGEKSHRIGENRHDDGWAARRASTHQSLVALGTPQ